MLWPQRPPKDIQKGCQNDTSKETKIVKTGNKCNKCNSCNQTNETKKTTNIELEEEMELEDMEPEDFIDTDDDEIDIEESSNYIFNNDEILEINEIPEKEDIIEEAEPLKPIISNNKILLTELTKEKYHY